MSLRLSGLNPLSYLGVEPSQPPQLLYINRAPTIYDNQNVNVGTLWLYNNPGNEELWILLNIDGGEASWVKLYPVPSGGAESYVCNTGSATEAGGIINIIGVVDGDNNTGLLTHGTGNTIQLDAAQITYVTDGGNTEPMNDQLRIIGDGTVTTSASGNTVTIAIGTDVPTQFNADTGTATPIANTLNMDGANVVTSTGSGNTITYGLTQGTNGQLIIGSTGNPPLWANLTSSDGSITITEGPNSIDLVDTSSSAAAFKGFFAYLTTSQNPTDGANVGGFSQEPIICDATVFDTTGGGYNTTTGIFTVQQTGYYNIIGNISVESSPYGDYCGCAIARTVPPAVNFNTYVYGEQTPTTTSTYPYSVTGLIGVVGINTDLYLTAGDEITFYMYRVLSAGTDTKQGFVAAGSDYNPGIPFWVIETPQVNVYYTWWQVRLMK